MEAEDVILVTDLSDYINSDYAEELIKECYCLITQARRDRINRYKNRNDRIRSMAGLMLLNICIQKYKKLLDNQMEELSRKYNCSIIDSKTLMVALDLKELLELYNAEYDYDIDYTGKPKFINEPDIHFNITHSGCYAACIVSSARCGIDIEGNRKITSCVIRHALNSTERDWVYKGALESDINSRFIRIWTAKEACSKLTGNGIYKELNQFTFVLNEDIGMEQFYMKQIKLKSKESKDYFLAYAIEKI